MRVFNITREFNQINISSHRHVNQLIERIEFIGLGEENEIEIDIQGCQTDYPETPKLIDYFLYHLAKQTGEKIFTIKFDGLGTREIYILYDIILEGRYFDINEKIDSNEILTIWQKKMNDKLKADNIILKIVYTPEDRTYTYGQND